MNELIANCEQLYLKKQIILVGSVVRSNEQNYWAEKIYNPITISPLDPLLVRGRRSVVWTLPVPLCWIFIVTLLLWLGWIWWFVLCISDATAAHSSGTGDIFSVILSLDRDKGTLFVKGQLLKLTLTPEWKQRNIKYVVMQFITSFIC